MIRQETTSSGQRGEGEIHPIQATERRLEINGQAEESASKFYLLTPDFHPLSSSVSVIFPLAEL